MVYSIKTIRDINPTNEDNIMVATITATPKQESMIREFMLKLLTFQTKKRFIFYTNDIFLNDDGSVNTTSIKTFNEYIKKHLIPVRVKCDVDSIHIEKYLKNKTISETEIMLYVNSLSIESYAVVSKKYMNCMLNNHRFIKIDEPFNIEHIEEIESIL